jgi:hypothetical protein
MPPASFLTFAVTLEKNNMASALTAGVPYNSPRGLVRGPCYLVPLVLVHILLELPLQFDLLVCDYYCHVQSPLVSQGRVSLQKLGPLACIPSMFAN